MRIAVVATLCLDAYYQRAISSTRSRSITASNESVQDYGDVIVRTADVVIDQTFQDGRTAATPAAASGSR